jgi:hypothetical protein
MPPFTQQQLDEAFAQAKDLRSKAESNEQWDELWNFLRELRPLGKAVFDGALALLNGNYLDRCIGCDLLGILCNPDEYGWSHEAAEAIVRLAEKEQDDGVLWSVASSLSLTSDPIAIPILARLAGHRDEDIRMEVARGIAGCRTYEEGEDTLPICDVLLLLSEDVDCDVRDWATFGLGSQLDSDSPRLRNALVLRLEDGEGDTHWEAVVGLARRHDKRSFELVSNGLLAESVPLLAVQAAAWLGDVRLHTMLSTLGPWWTEWPAALERALDQCDPGKKAQRLVDASAFLAGFESAQRVGRAAGVSIALSCPCVGVSEGDVFVDTTTDSGVGRTWGLHELIEARCGGDPDKAVEALLADIGTSNIVRES